jgi:hypothetical protein
MPASGLFSFTSPISQSKQAASAQTLTDQLFAKLTAQSSSQPNFIMSGIVNKIKEAVHGDHHTTSSTTGTTGTTGTHGTHGTHTGTGGLTGTTNTSGTAEGVAGPHNSRIANTLDPRVDSDRDGSTRVGGTTGTTGTHATHGTHTGTTGGVTSGTAGGAREGEYGPHSSRLANVSATVIRVFPKRTLLLLRIH